MTALPRSLSALAAAGLLLAGCGGNAMSGVDQAWEAQPDAIEDLVTATVVDGLFTETHRYVEEATEAFEGETLTFNFVDNELDEADMRAQLEPLVAEMIDELEDLSGDSGTASGTLIKFVALSNTDLAAMLVDLALGGTIYSYLVADSDDWHALEERTLDGLVAAMAGSMSLDMIQPGWTIWSLDDGCTGARIEQLGSISVDITDVVIASEHDSIDLTIELGSPELVIDELWLWREKPVLVSVLPPWGIICEQDQLEDIAISLPGMTFNAATVSMVLDGGSESYAWPTVSVTETAGACNATVTVSSRIHDILYGESVDDRSDVYRWSAVQGVTENEPEGSLSDQLDGMTNWEIFKALDIDASFLDWVDVAQFGYRMLDDLADIALGAAGDWVADTFGHVVASALVPPTPSVFAAIPWGPASSLHGDRIALYLEVVPESDSSQFGMELSYTVDSDDDGLFDPVDNCPDGYNPFQSDSDFDGVGDYCDDTVDMPSGLISFFVGEWRDDAEQMARLAAIVECGTPHLDPGLLFDQAGIAHAKVVEDLELDAAQEAYGALDELIWRIKDRYDERWPGDEDWLVAAIDEWITDADLDVAQLRAVRAWIAAAITAASGEVDADALVIQQLQAASSRIQQHIQSSMVGQ